MSAGQDSAAQASLGSAVTDPAPTPFVVLINHVACPGFVAEDESCVMAVDPDDLQIAMVIAVLVHEPGVQR